MGSAEFMLISGLICAGYSVYLAVSVFLSGNNDQAALQWANNEEPVKSKNKIINWCRPLVHQLTLRYAKYIQNPEYRKKIERSIKTAGLTKELNVDEFIGFKIFLGIGMPAFFLLMNFTLELDLPILVLLGVGAVGFFMPEMHCKQNKQERERSVRADLPFFIDLLALSVEAGLDFFSSIQKIVDKSRGTDSVLAEEFNTVLQDIKIGASKAKALTELAERLDLKEMTSFVAMLVDAEATGASVSQVLKDQSQQMRLERFLRAEKEGAKAAQKILIPLMTFILPAVFIVVVGPIILQFMYGN